MTRARRVYMFQNGMVMVFDKEGEQIPECQGFILDEGIVERLRYECGKDTVFRYGDWPKGQGIACNFKWWFEKKEATEGIYGG